MARRRQEQAVPKPALAHPTQLSVTRDDPEPPALGKPRQAPANGGGDRKPRRAVEPFYTVAELAARLALSERTVRDMLNRGEIPCYRIGPQRRIDPADLRRWLEQKRERR